LLGFYSVAANSEIGNQKLCRCRFRNRQRKLRRCRFRHREPNCVSADSKIGSKTAALPIQKSAAKMCRCRFRNQQWKTVSLSIPKSTAMVQSFLAVLFLVFTKIESLLTQKTSMKNCVAVHSEIGSDGAIIFCCICFGVYKNWVAVDSENINETASSVDAWICQRTYSLLIQKSLMKIESLSTQELSMKSILQVTHGIVSAHIPLLTHKSSMKSVLQLKHGIVSAHIPLLT